MRRCILVGCMALAVLTSVALAGAGGDKGSGKSADVERILSVGHEQSQVMDHLDVLCNRIGPRLTGSDNLTNACEWARDRFSSFGIDNARLEQWGEFPVGFDRGPWFGRVIEPEAKSLDLVTVAWSAGTKGVVRGKAVLAPTSKKELDEVKEKGTMAGAWVIMGRERVAVAGARRQRPLVLETRRRLPVQPERGPGFPPDAAQRAGGCEGGRIRHERGRERAAHFRQL